MNGLQFAHPNLQLVFKKAASSTIEKSRFDRMNEGILASSGRIANARLPAPRIAEKRGSLKTSPVVTGRPLFARLALREGESRRSDVQTPGDA
jgi:hypothetical protein